MRVTIDRDECISCGSCWTICPDFFEADDDEGKSEVVAQFRVKSAIDVGEAPDALDCVREAAEACPVSAIHLEATGCVASYGP